MCLLREFESFGYTLRTSNDDSSFEKKGLFGSKRLLLSKYYQNPIDLNQVCKVVLT